MDWQSCSLLPEAVSSLDLPCKLCALDPPVFLPFRPPWAPNCPLGPVHLPLLHAQASGPTRPHPAPCAISLPHPTPGCVPLFPTGQPVFSKRSRPREPGPRLARGKRKRISEGQEILGWSPSSAPRASGFLPLSSVSSSMKRVPGFVPQGDVSWDTNETKV